MHKKLMLCVLAAALCAGSALNLAFAQEAAPDWSAASAAMGTETPTAEIAEEVSESAEREVNTAEIVEATRLEAAPVAEAPVEFVEDAKPAKPEKVKKVKAPKEPKAPKAPRPPREPKETTDEPGSLALGFRGSVGISAFHGHKPVRTFPHYDILLGSPYSAGLSASAGLSLAYEAEFLSFTVDVLYSLYQARGGVTDKKFATEFGSLLCEAGVELHTIDVPLLARMDFGSSEEDCTVFYVEAGPQIGVNLYGKLYENVVDLHKLTKLELKTMSFGPAVGVGVIVDGVLFGVRGYYNALHYAQKTYGRPWSIHAGATMRCIK